MTKTDWQRFFDGQAPVYLDNCFTRNTKREVSFLVKELRLKRGASVLDIGCGAGRHAVELARRGFAVTGIDLSRRMLAEARKNAEHAGVALTLMQGDAARFRATQRYDAVICLCEGAFGLLGQGDDATGQPLAILRRTARSLKPGALCLFTVLNGYRMVRRHSQQEVEEGLFDPLTLSELSEGREPGNVTMRERAFVPTELGLMFRMAGLHVLHIWGGTAGEWRRSPPRLDEWEVMVVAGKGGS